MILRALRAASLSDDLSRFGKREDEGKPGVARRRDEQADSRRYVNDNCFLILLQSCLKISWKQWHDAFYYDSVIKPIRFSRELVLLCVSGNGTFAR